MSRSNKGKTAPPWAIEDNPYSKFGFVYADMLKSDKVKQLPPKCKYVLICCIVHSSVEIQKECLYNTLHEYNDYFDKHMTEDDIRNMTYDKRLGYFVFPHKQYKEYGFNTPSEVSRYLTRLKDDGFIRVVWQRTSPKKPNIYQFSTEWKRKQNSKTNGGSNPV